MKNAQVIVVDPDPAWPAIFRFEETLIRQTLRAGTPPVQIHHIGSTSVPGLCAKPIIDMLLEVSRISDLDNDTDRMRTIGYHALGEYGIPGRRYFVRSPELRAFHLHAFATGDENLQRHLAFRDYMRAFPEIAREYGELKVRVAESCNHDIDRYCDGKDAFIKHHEARALEWYARR